MRRQKLSSLLVKVFFADLNEKKDMFECSNHDNSNSYLHTKPGLQVIKITRQIETNSKKLMQKMQSIKLLNKQRFRTLNETVFECKAKIVHLFEDSPRAFKSRFLASLTSNSLISRNLSLPHEINMKSHILIQHVGSRTN